MTTVTFFMKEPVRSAMPNNSSEHGLVFFFCRDQAHPSSGGRHSRLFNTKSYQITVLTSTVIASFFLQVIGSAKYYL